MSDIYVMQRANGDLFALDHHGRFGVPLFSSSGDAMVARSRNVEMLLFKPVALDASLLRELGPATDVDLWLVSDPLMTIKHGRLLDHAQLVLLLGSPIEPQIVSAKESASGVPVLSRFPQSGGSSTDTWEDEGGKTQSVPELAVIA